MKNMSTKLIAEIGWNHMGDMELAENMITQAAKSGAEFAKFQTWKVERLKSGAWDFDGRREIYEKAELSIDNHLFLIDCCKRNNINFLSSAFSLPDAILLKELDCSAVKIPSFECTNYELIEFCNNNFEELIISTGTATENEVKYLIDKIDNDKTTIMHCVSCYPCDSLYANLPRINFLKELFNNVGFSDHTQGINVACASLSYSVNYIEKHFTTDKDLPGRDNKFAILPNEMKNLFLFVQDYDKSNIYYGNDYRPEEIDSRNNYRSRFNKII